MNIKILIFIASVVFTTCSIDFTDEQMNGLKKEMKKGHNEFADCLKAQLTQPNQDINDFIGFLKEEDYDTIEKLKLKRGKEEEAVYQCFKTKNDESSPDWAKISKCAEKYAGKTPCGKTIFKAIESKQMISVIYSIAMCPPGVRKAIMNCF